MRETKILTQHELPPATEYPADGPFRHIVLNRKLAVGHVVLFPVTDNHWCDNVLIGEIGIKGSGHF